MRTKDTEEMKTKKIKARNEFLTGIYPAFLLNLYTALDKSGKTIDELEKDSTLTANKLKRVGEGKTALTMDDITSIATAVKVEPKDLLMPVESGNKTAKKKVTKKKTAIKKKVAKKKK